MIPSEAPSDRAPFLERCFLFDAVEGSHEVTAVTGRIPEWLRGSYYVNGPARFVRGDFRYAHWLDGDGMVCALHISGERVEFVSRFVRTRKLVDEEEAGRPLYRAFGTAFSGDRLRRGVMLEPPVNVSVYPFAGALLAFGEQSLPIALDPRTLETRSCYDFHGSLNDLSPFAAHAKFDASSGHMLNFGVAYAASRPTLNVYEFDRNGHQVRRRRHALDMPHSMHDFGVSREHLVFFLGPLLFDADRFRAGATVLDALAWIPEKRSRLLVAPRTGSLDRAFTITVGSGYCLHLINCFESDGQLVVDLLELDAPVYPQYRPMPDLFATAPLGRPTRYLIDLNRRTLIARIPMDYDRTPDFPAVDPRLCGQPYDDFWMLGLANAGAHGRKFFDQLAHASWQKGGVSDIYQLGPGEYFSGEPVFVPSPEHPDEAVIIVQHLNACSNEAAIVLFDAFDVARGPFARLPLRHRLHPGFHATFVSRPPANAQRVSGFT